MHIKLLLILCKYVVLLFVVIWGVGCSSHSTSTRLVEKVEFHATVLGMQFTDEKLERLEIKLVLPDGTDSKEVIKGRALLPFKRYTQVQLGDGFLLRKTSYTESKNALSQAQYNILYFYPWKSQSLQFSEAGGVVFGTALSDYDRRYVYVSGTPESDCFYVSMKDLPGLAFMVQDGQLVRAEGFDLFFATRNTPFAYLYDKTVPFSQWQSKFPNIEVTPHEYERGDYLTWHSDDKQAAIVVEYVGGDVQLIRAGLIPYVTYVEGCS